MTFPEPSKPNSRRRTMDKEEALQAIKLLSALESWAFSQSTRLPDYLVDDIQRSMNVLERVVLEEKP